MHKFLQGMNINKIIVYTLFLFIIISFPVNASNNDYTLDAPHIGFESHSNQINASGGVVFESDGLVVKADELVIFVDKNKIEARGERVELETSERNLKGTHLEYNYLKQTGKMFGVESKIDELNFRGKEIKILEDKGHDSEIEEAVFTPCIMPDPHYHIRAERLKIYPDRMIRAENVQFFWGESKVFSLPSYVIEYTEDEETGESSLSSPNPVPRLGYDSEKGIKGELTYPYVLSSNSEGEFYLSGARRGDQRHYIEHEHSFNDNTHWQGGYQYDREIEDENEQSSTIEENSIHSTLEHELTDRISLKNNYNFIQEIEDKKEVERESIIDGEIDYKKGGLSVAALAGYNFFNEKRNQEITFDHNNIPFNHNISLKHKYINEKLDKEDYRLYSSGNIVDWSLKYREGYDIDYLPYLNLSLPEVYHISSKTGIGKVREDKRDLNKADIYVSYKDDYQVNDIFSFGVNQQYIHHFYQADDGEKNQYNGFKSEFNFNGEGKITEKIDMKGSLNWQKTVDNGEYWLESDEIEEKHIVKPSLEIDVKTPEPQSSLKVDGDFEYDIEDEEWKEIGLGLTRRYDCYSYSLNYEIINKVIGVEINLF